LNKPKLLLDTNIVVYFKKLYKIPELRNNHTFYCTPTFLALINNISPSSREEKDIVSLAHNVSFWTQNRLNGSALFLVPKTVVMGQFLGPEILWERDT
jgi:hypothetical protein